MKWGAKSFHLRGPDLGDVGTHRPGTPSVRRGRLVVARPIPRRHPRVGDGPLRAQRGELGPGGSPDAPPVGPGAPPGLQRDRVPGSQRGPPGCGSRGPGVARVPPPILPRRGGPGRVPGGGRRGLGDRRWAGPPCSRLRGGSVEDLPVAEPDPGGGGRRRGAGPVGSKRGGGGRNLAAGPGGNHLPVRGAWDGVLRSGSAPNVGGGVGLGPPPRARRRRLAPHHARHIRGPGVDSASGGRTSPTSSSTT